MRYPRNIAWVCFLLLLLAGLAGAQDSKKEKESPLRTVKGVVADKSESPLAGAVVFLKNTRTNAVRSTFAGNEGEYRFSGLDPNADYEVRAEFEGAKSPAKTVSSLDNRREIVLNLKIDRKKT
jgi:hypothetical protein